MTDQSAATSTGPLRAGRRTAQAVLLIAAVLACFPLLARANPSDLDVYRAGARAVLNGAELYEVRLGRLGFTYPPLAGLALTPLAILPRWGAAILLTIVSAAALKALTARSLTAPTATRDGRIHGWLLIGAAVLMLSEPVRSTIAFGQINLLLAAAILLDLTGPPRSRWRGVLVGVATAVKLTPGLFVLYLLVRRRYAEAIRAGLAFTAVTVAAAIVLPHDSARFWTQELTGGGVGNFASDNNNSLYGLLVRTLPGGPAFGACALLAPIAVGVGLVCAARLSSRGDEVAAIGAVGITACVVSPVAWDHHWVWCLPLLLGLAAAPGPWRGSENRSGTQSENRSGTQSGSRSGSKVLLVVAGAVFAARDLLRPLDDRLPLGLEFVVTNAFVLVAAIAAWCCLSTPARAPRTGPPAPDGGRRAARVPAASGPAGGGGDDL